MINQFYLYFYLNQEDVTERIRHLNTNSAQPGINQESLKSLEILLPKKEIMDQFGDIAEKAVSLILKNSIENKNLAELRDSLLPRLMSGKIRVKK